MSKSENLKLETASYSNQKAPSARCFGKLSMTVFLEFKRFETVIPSEVEESPFGQQAVKCKTERKVDSG